MSTTPLSARRLPTRRGRSFRVSGSLVLAIATLAASLATSAARAQEGPVQDGPPVPEAPKPPLQIMLTYDAAFTDSYTGPVYVVFASGGPPRMVPRNFGRDPVVVTDVTDWRPGTPLLIDAGNARSAPMDFEDIPAGRYFVQAYMALSPDSFKPGDVGNVASRTLTMREESFDQMPIELQIDRELEPMVLGGGSERIITRSFASPLLSEFHGETIEIGYTVALPPGYFIETERQYPTRIWIGSHGTSHRLGAGALRPLERADGGNDIVTVLVEITTRFGHPLFVNSASSGPWEQAFLEELLPRIESEFRLDPRGRFLIGHAAGAWSALWLQINHPDDFASAFAIAPWPASFESWFEPDLYEATNALVDENGVPRAYGFLAEDTPAEPAATTWRREDLFVNGGPFRSFEWAFSPRGDDGQPMPFFDRATGVIDRSVIDHWAQFDLTRLIRERGRDLAPKLNDKITVRVGGKDGFRLHKPSRLFADALTEAGIRFSDEFLPEGRHGDIANVRYQMDLLQVMVDRYLEIVRGEAPPPDGAAGGVGGAAAPSSGTG